MPKIQEGLQNHLQMPFRLALLWAPSFRVGDNLWLFTQHFKSIAPPPSWTTSTRAHFRSWHRSVAVTFQLMLLETMKVHLVFHVFYCPQLSLAFVQPSLSRQEQAWSIPHRGEGEWILTCFGSYKSPVPALMLWSACTSCGEEAGCRECSHLCSICCCSCTPFCKIMDLPRDQQTVHGTSQECAHPELV